MTKANGKMKKILSDGGSKSTKTKQEMVVFRFFLHKSESFTLTLYIVWLLVRAVTGGAISLYEKHHCSIS
jgi:hypothetical protein